MVKASDIKLVGLEKNKGYRKLRCGCIQMYVKMLGWVRLTSDPDLLCPRHQQEYYREFRSYKKKILKTSKVEKNVTSKKKNQNRR